jgi:transcriptional antiterminator NusG
VSTPARPTGDETARDELDVNGVTIDDQAPAAAEADPHAESDSASDEAPAGEAASADVESAAEDAADAEPAQTGDSEGAASDAAAEQDAPADEDAAADAEPAEDLAAEFRAALRKAPGRWYVVHSYAGYENKVKANLESRIKSLEMGEYIFQIEVPTEDVIEIKNGQRKQVQRKVYPGYILVRMDLTDASWSAVRNTPGVTGFVGATAQQPSP